MSPPSSDGVTRRQLLVRSGGAYLVLYGALARAAFAEDAADPLALSGARTATIAAVLAAVAADPGTGLAPDVVGFTTEQFGDYYAAAPDWLRGNVDDTLDRVESEAGGFAALQPPDALAVLQSWSNAGAPDGLTGDPRRTLAASALTLASLRFEEDELRQVGYTLQPA